MDPTSNAPGKQPAPAKPQHDGPLSKAEPTSGPSGSTYQPSQGQRPGDDRLQAILDSGKQAGEKWLDAHDVADTAKDLSSKALHGIKTMSTGQLALGVGVLAAGIAFFLTKGKRKYPKVKDQRGGRHKTKGHPTGHQPHTPRGNDMSRRGERPFGASRFGNDGSSYGRGRVQAGSGYKEHRGNGPRRDQGPSNGTRYDPRTAGRQNPNNVDRPGNAY